MSSPSSDFLARTASSVSGCEVNRRTGLASGAPALGSESRLRVLHGEVIAGTHGVEAVEVPACALLRLQPP